MNRKEQKETKQLSGIELIHRGIFWYLGLLIFEGVLRKWIFPGFAQYLLLIRDPVVLWIYYMAFKHKVFPRNRFIASIVILACASFLAGLVAPHGMVPVTIYGVRANFFYLPFIFLIPEVMNLDDVKKIGRWALIIAIPMALLMTRQFTADYTDFVNVGAGGGAGQAPSALGKIRPAGTFSFITGPAAYFPAVVAFVIYGIFTAGAYNYFLLITASVAMVVASLVSGSRSLVLGNAVILVIAGFLLSKRPELFKKYLKVLISIIIVIIIAVSLFDFVSEGLKVLEIRFLAGGGVQKGVIMRFISGFTEMFKIYLEVPLFGHGIGKGTIVGAKLLTGRAGFMIAENEWTRIIMESGIVLGIPYLVLRICIVVFLWKKSIEALRKGNILPILLFGACAIDVLTGQFGQSTALGFTTAKAGLCLAACQDRGKDRTGGPGGTDDVSIPHQQ